MSFFIAFNDKNKGLNASRHDGIAKEGLTECGRLNKGFKFNMTGKIVKVAPKNKIVKNAHKQEKPADKVVEDIVKDEKIIKSIAKKSTYKLVKNIVKVKKNVEPISEKIIYNFEKKYNISLLKFVETLNSSSKQLFVYDIYETVSSSPLDRDNIDWNEFYILLVTECYKQKLTLKNKMFLDNATYKFDTSKLNLRNSNLLKKSGFESFKNIVSRDSTRPAMQGVYCEKDMYVGTDAHKIVLIKSDIEVKNIGKILNINSKEIPYKSFIDNKFPDYKQLFNDLVFNKQNSIDILDLIKNVQNFVNATKILVHTPIYTLLPLSGNYEFNFNSFFLLDTLLCLEANGTKLINIYCTDYNKIIFETDNGNRALLMSMNTAVYGQNKNVIIQNANPLKIVELKQGLNGSNVTNPRSNQVGLFGMLEISTEQFKKMTVTELREFTLKFYNENLKGKKVAINKVLKSVEFVGNVGKKLFKPMYSAKVAVLNNLEELIKNSTYNNWGKRKCTDSDDVLGYLNFKSKLLIDGEKKHLTISIILDTQRNTRLKSYSIGKKQEKTKTIDKAHCGNSLDGSKVLVSSNKYNKNNTKKPNSGLNFTVTEPKPVITPKKSNDLMNMNFDELPINENWNQLMQSPASNMKIAIWGAPKNGKTSGALQLAEYLTNFGSVLYDFADQGFNKSTQDLWRNSGLANNPNATPSDIDTIANLEKEVATGKYKFVFIDMISEFIRKEKIRPEEFKERFIKKFPNISFVLIFEVTKGGNFKGDQGWTHLVDAIMTVEDFIITNRGRYGSGDKIIWHEGAKKFNPKKYNEILSIKEIKQEPTILKFKSN